MAVTDNSPALAPRPSAGNYASGGAAGGTPTTPQIPAPPAVGGAYPLKLAKLPQPQNKMPQPGG